MILRRIGKKTKIAHKIIEYFPKHDIYIEPFFGAGGMFFAKPRAMCNILNDLDSEVYNLFTVLLRKKQELTEYLELMPVHVDFWDECKTRTPENDVERAVYFIMLSNFGYFGIPETIRFNIGRNSKYQILKNIEKTYKNLATGENTFMNCDFREVISKIAFDNERRRNTCFIYSDPPYLSTDYTYGVKWAENDVVDCFDMTFNSGIRGAMSEFDNPFVVELAKERGLNVIPIVERCNLKNRRNEILITNYEVQKSLF